MDHILNLFMACNGAMELCECESDSDDDVNDVGDAESNCSVYGSTTSNEGDTHDEEELEDLDNEALEGPNFATDDNGPANNDQYIGISPNNMEEHVGNAFPNQVQLVQPDDNVVHQFNVAPEFNFELNPENMEGYVNHEHDYAHDRLRDGIVVEVHPINPDFCQAELPPVESETPPNVVNDNNTVELQSQISSFYFSRSESPSQSLKSDSAKSILSLSSEVEDNKRNCSDIHEDKIKVKRMKTQECPIDLGTEVTIRSEKVSPLYLCIDEDHYPNMSSLPDDMLLEIFGKLGVNTLINIAPVCKRWYELSKHRSLWHREDVVYDYFHAHQFMRHVRAAKYLRSVDVSVLHTDHEEVLLTLLNGPTNVRRFSCFRVAHPRVIVELLERYHATLEELNISLSDERLSYGEGGTFKDGVKPRPGFLLKLIAAMKNLRVLRLTGNMPSIGHHQGRVNPKWYFGELENPELKLQAIAMKFEKPREILLQKFIVPFLRSKIPFLKELRITSDLWKNSEIQDIVRNCDKLEAVVRFPIDCLHALENCAQQFFIDFILGSWIDFSKIQGDLEGTKALSHIHEVSLRFSDQLYIKSEEQIPDKRLETFLPFLAGRLHSCKRVHIFRLNAAPPFVESVHSTSALTKFLYTLRHTLEEVHISDAFRGGRHFPQLMKAIRGSVPHLKSRGIAVNRLGNKGLLFSIRRKQDSVIPHTAPLSVELG